MLAYQTREEKNLQENGDDREGERRRSVLILGGPEDCNEDL